MPNLKNAKKALRQSEKKAVFNKKVKDSVRGFAKQATKAIEAKDIEKAKDFSAKFFKAVDKAVGKNIIKKKHR